jgi:hypothetical protein
MAGMPCLPGDLFATLLVTPHCTCMADQPASIRDRARTLRQIARATSLVTERKQMLVLAQQLEEEAASLEGDRFRDRFDGRH